MFIYNGICSLSTSMIVAFQGMTQDDRNNFVKPDQLLN